MTWTPSDPARDSVGLEPAATDRGWRLALRQAPWAASVALPLPCAFGPVLFAPHVISPRTRLLLGLALAALGTACQAQIGDECRRSTDCSIRGERICDLSNRINSVGAQSANGQGECTIEGCGRGTCPNEAACVSVFGTDFLSVACDATREDLAITCDPSMQSCPEDCVESSQGGGLLVCGPRNDCQPNEICLDEGLCADEITARTSCRRKCKNNGDCRAGYECRRTGSDGVYRVFDPDDPTDDSQIGICRPRA